MTRREISEGAQRAFPDRDESGRFLRENQVKRVEAEATVRRVFAQIRRGR